MISSSIYINGRFPASHGADYQREGLMSGKKNVPRKTVNILNEFEQGINHTFFVGFSETRFWALRDLCFTPFRRRFFPCPRSAAKGLQLVHRWFHPRVFPELLDCHGCHGQVPMGSVSPSYHWDDHATARPCWHDTWRIIFFFMGS